MEPRPGRTPVARLLATALTVLVAAGCTTAPECDRATVSQKVQERFGRPVGTGPCPDRALVPEGFETGKPMAEDQAVLVALYNNAAFHEALVELDLTRADLLQAGLLPNPEFVYFWGEPNKPLKYLIDFPIEAIWLRPVRLKVAAAENARACDRVTQLALDLIRDTRTAYADLRLAHDQLKVTTLSVELRERVAGLVETRLKAGDASALELSTAQIDTLQAAQELTRARYEVAAVQERLRNLTGLSRFPQPLVPDDVPFDPRTDATVDRLVSEAISSRPDAAAAVAAAAAAGERARVARLSWFRVLGILDATSGRASGHEFGPAVRLTVPLFNHGQGLTARADAEFEQLSRRRQTVHDLIVQDVRTAYARYQQARAELDLLRTKTRPEVEANIRRAESAFRDGNATFLIVLEANRQLIATYAREAQLAADLRRAWAELERGVGRRLGALIPTVSQDAGGIPVKPQ
ncbi:MAG: TolC family protein [Gemmataceae bacterium]